MVSIPSMKNEELVRMRMLNVSKRKPEIEDVRARNLKKLEKVQHSYCGEWEGYALRETGQDTMSTHLQ